MKTLDKLLDRIEKEPLSKQRSISEDLFFLGLEGMYKTNREEYIRYILRYNELKNSKYRVVTQ